MKLGIIGSGYIGKTLGKYFLSAGHYVLFYDINIDILARLKNQDYNVTNELNEIAKCDISFICVSTPIDSSGNLILENIISVSQGLGKALKTIKNEHIVVVKSTILPGTTENVILPTILKYSSRPIENLGIIYSPEFITEISNTWTEDNNFVVKPDNEFRIVLGEGDNKKWGDKLIDELYFNIDLPIIRTDYKTAEMIKYASNCALACRISYWNEIFLICEKLGINSNVVAEACSYDPRIGKYGTIHGKAFGGKCLPKDLKAFISFSERIHDVHLLKAVDMVNEYMRKHYGVRDK